LAALRDCPDFGIAQASRLHFLTDDPGARRFGGCPKGAVTVGPEQTHNPVPKLGDPKLV
jgi:hypothetical protein